MELPVKEEDVFLGLVIAARTIDGESGFETYISIPDYELAKDGLYSALVGAIENGLTREASVIQLFEIMVSAVEQIKSDYPEIAANIRKMNFQHLKSKKDDKSND